MPWNTITLWNAAILLFSIRHTVKRASASVSSHPDGEGEGAVGTPSIHPGAPARHGAYPRATRTLQSGTASMAA
ncbi:hypothetical protein DFJ74DRAFT_697454 [Hyaloraphidium curvatum]|nr:hypothetical protein DFJ74DRAFT_697454 [Hyaloraphidium curvatum]